MTASLVDRINERVFAEWNDPTIGPMTLGSLSVINKQDSCFTLKVSFDGPKVFLRFSVRVSFKVSNRHYPRDLFLVLPLEALSAQDGITFEHVKTSDIGVAASTVHDAGLSDAGYIIRAHFNLKEAGYILMPRTKAKTIRPSTLTSRQLLSAFQSLSQALSFDIYMKPSDYAREGLRTVCQRLFGDSREALEQLPLVLSEMYNERGAEVLTREKVDMGPERPPPPYQDEEDDLPNLPPFKVTPTAENSLPAVTLPPNAAPSTPIPASTSPQGAAVSPNVLLHRSRSPSPRYAISHTPSSHGSVVSETSFEEAAPATTTCMRAPVESIFASAELAPLPADCVPPRQSTAPIPADVRSRTEKRRRASPDLVPPKHPQQREQRGSSDQAVQKLPGSRIIAKANLMAAFSAWTNKAVLVNETIYNHSRLQFLFKVLGQHARHGDEAAFYATFASMSATFYYDPHDDVADEELGSRGAKTFVRDMELLNKWVLSMDVSAHSLLFDDMFELGNVAREAVGKGALGPSTATTTAAVAPDAGHRLKQYNERKVFCISYVTVCLGGSEEDGGSAAAVGEGVES